MAGFNTALHYTAIKLSFYKKEMSFWFYQVEPDKITFKTFSRFFYNSHGVRVNEEVIEGLVQER